MTNNKVLFINQEIMPYLPESEMSKAGLDLPKGIQERGLRCVRLCLNMGALTSGATSCTK